MSLLPELRRRYWVEITPKRLLLGPLFLGGWFLIYLTWVFDGNPRPGAVRDLAVLTFAFLAFVWGTRGAADAVSREVAGGTWDQQRLATISPWAMVWGKLLGGPLHAWYLALFCLGIFAWQAQDGYGWSMTSSLIAFLASAALLVHAWGLALALLAAARGQILSRAVLAALQWGAFSLMAGFLLLGRFTALAGEDLLLWHGYAFPRFPFLLLSLWGGLAWSLMALRHLMGSQMGHPLPKGGWIAFMLFLAFFGSGFFTRPGPQAFSIMLAQSLFILMGAGYLEALFSPPRQAVSRRQADLWLLMAGFWALFMALPLGAGDGGGTFPFQALFPKSFLTALVLFFFRDMMALNLLGRWGAGRLRLVTAGFYLALVWVALPQVIRQGGGGAPALAESFLLPQWNAAPVLLLLPPLVEILLLAGFTLLSWRRPPAAPFPSTD